MSAATILILGFSDFKGTGGGGDHDPDNWVLIVLLIAILAVGAIILTGLLT